MAFQFSGTCGAKAPTSPPLDPEPARWLLAVVAVLNGRRAGQNAREAQDNFALAVTREAQAVANAGLAAMREAEAQNVALVSGSQAALAKKAGVSRQTINAIETEKYDPSLPLAFKLAQIFELQIEHIFSPD